MKRSSTIVVSCSFQLELSELTSGITPSSAAPGAFPARVARTAALTFRATSLRRRPPARRCTTTMSDDDGTPNSETTRCCAVWAGECAGTISLTAAVLLRLGSCVTANTSTAIQPTTIGHRAATIALAIGPGPGCVGSLTAVAPAAGPRRAAVTSPAGRFVDREDGACGRGNRGSGCRCGASGMTRHLPELRRNDRAGCGIIASTNTPGRLHDDFTAMIAAYSSRASVDPSFLVRMRECPRGQGRGLRPPRRSCIRRTDRLRAGARRCPIARRLTGPGLQAVARRPR